jgi:hypothetical protein
MSYDSGRSALRPLVIRLIFEEKNLNQDRLMTTPSQFVLSRLSKDLYLDFLKTAKEKGFAFVCFQDFLGKPSLPPRYIALRHDIDFAPNHSLEMAQLEHDVGIKSTFFVLVDGQFYDPLETEIIRQIRAIHSLGHEIGLHFAVSSSVDVDIAKEVAFRLKILSAIADTTVRSYSQHDPVNAGFVRVSLPPDHHECVDVSQVIREHELLYVSDSAMMWRRHTFHSALDEQRNLCLLAHPHSWLHPQNDYVAMIREFEAIQVKGVTDRYDTFVNALSSYYSRRLNEGV